ncbi:MAG: hypothetical protein GY881_13685 [Gammaproteobacteria bacterium]|nr:hypothetical protein [Gammaproteobacteria bacterium]MCP4880131.1 hypothetical protein [Gammaproteobacteria bacterium]MDP6164724.1 hypothetical protein [Gammaproteobacteria bacterium]
MIIFVSRDELTQAYLGIAALAMKDLILCSMMSETWTIYCALWCYPLNNMSSP